MSSSVGVRQRARIEKRAFRNIAPTQRRTSEFDEAVVHPPCQIILAASLVEHFARHLAERLQDRVVELANLDRRIVGKLVERNGIVGGEIRIRERVLGGGRGLDDTSIGVAEAVP